MLDSTCNGLFRFPSVLVLSCVRVGLYRKSLWLDELAVTDSIVRSGFGQLAQPLSNRTGRAARMAVGGASVGQRLRCE